MSLSWLTCHAGAAHLVEQVPQVGAVQLARHVGHAAGQVGVADDRHAGVLDRLAGLGQLAVAAGLGREIDDHRAGLHRLDHVGQPQLGRRLAGDERGRDDDVDLGRLLAEQRHLGVDELLAHLLGVAALTLARLGDLDGQELGAHRLHLIGDRRPDVEGADDRAQALGGAERGQAGDAGADHQHLGRRDLAGGGDLAGEERTEALGGLDDRAVARDVGHRRQRVDLLGPADARDAVHRQDRGLARGQAIDQLAVLRRIQERDHDLALARAIGLVATVGELGRRADLAQDVGGRPHLLGGGGDGRAGGQVERVGVAGAGAGAGLDHHLPAGLDPLAHRRRGGSDAALVGADLLDDA
jgi:hypothetical protein